MKTLISIVALAASVTAASAMSSDGLSGADAFEVRRFVPNADLSGLTDAQANAISSAIHGGDDHVGGQIRSILNWN